MFFENLGEGRGGLVPERDAEYLGKPQTGAAAAHANSLEGALPTPQGDLPPQPDPMPST